MDRAMAPLESPVIHSPRPVPEFTPESPFSQRKRTPFRAPRPPSAPARTCSPVSRIFHGKVSSRSLAGPQLVSFTSEKNEDVMTTPLYNGHSSKSYFEQCFHICEKLGEGSFGEVYRVRSREDGRMYAVKKSRERFRGGLDRKLKLAEVDKHERLPHHPNCVRFHKAWEERQKLYMQIELCQMSLSEYADIHGRIPEQQIWHMLVDLVNGLKHLHDHQLCHLDIKPANIFLANDQVTCKMGDFGLCSSIDQGFVDAMEGDPKYLAPELMSDQFGKPADIFSLGISLLELACELELPSGGEGWHLIREGVPVHVTKDLSPGLVSILSRMMHPDPQLRPTVDEILADGCVMLASYQYSSYKWCSWLSSACTHILGWLFMLLISLFPAKKPKDVVDGGSEVVDAWRGTPLHDESYSEDEDELFQSTLTAHMADDLVDPNAKFNRSWIRNSPVKYPRPVYSGPPIPLDFSNCRKT